jgi:predicted nicotinamide N-methyase
MLSVARGMPLYGDAPERDVRRGRHGVGHSTVDLPDGRIELAHPDDALEQIYAQNHRSTGAEPPYWAQPWPSGIVLATIVAGEDVTGVRVLELGCGLALPSLAAARRGARVLATDHAPGALRFAAHNARRNGIGLDVALCDWFDPWTAIAGAPWDLVLAADVLYGGSESLDALAELLPRLTDTTGEVWITDQDRPPARVFLDACGGWADVVTTPTEQPGIHLHTLRHRPLP